VTDDAFVLLVEGVHRSPGERDTIAQLAGVVGQACVLPSGVNDVLIAYGNRKPTGVAEVTVLRGSVLADENARANVADWKVSDRIAAWLVEQQHFFAVSDPFAGQLDAKPSAKALHEQQSIWKRFRGEEAAH